MNIENTSKIFLINDKYYNEKHFEIQKFDENYVIHELFEYFVNISIKQTKIYSCKRCQSKFYFNNKFHRHLRSC